MIWKTWIIHLIILKGYGKHYLQWFNNSFFQHSYQTHYKMHNNTNTHIHVRKKIMFVNFIIHCFLWVKQNISIFKRFKRKWWYIISKILNSLNLNESTYILSLRSKLTKPHIFFKKTFKNIKINAFSICAVHLWFANTNIQFILDSYVVATYYTSHMKK
jgi:hypothetical protein